MWVTAFDTTVERLIWSWYA